MDAVSFAPEGLPDMADRRTIRTVIPCLFLVLCTLQNPHLYPQSPGASPLTQTPKPKAVAEFPATPQLTPAQRAALITADEKRQQAATAAAQKQQTTQQSTQTPLQITLSDNPRTPYAGQPVLITVTPNHAVSDVTYFFEWGDHTDNTSSRIPQSAHTYVSPGNYLVTVQVRAIATLRQEPVSSTLPLVVNRLPVIQTPQNGGSNQIIPKITQPSLHISLTSNPGVPYAGQTDYFTVTPNYPTSNAKYLFEWGDKTPSTPSNEPQAHHVYTNPGTYNVIVQVRALANDNEVATRNTLTVVVNPPPPPPRTIPTPTQTYTPTPPPNPTLTLTSSQTHALTGQPITFTVASDPPTGFTRFQYQFGDTEGPGIPGPNGVQHAYTQPGTYYASASTQSADGQSTLTSSEVQLRIDPAPLPELLLTLVTANPVATGSTVVDATLDPREPDETYRFDWGDGTPAETVGIIGRASHIYATPGQYVLSVVAITVSGDIPGQKPITEGTPPPPPPPPIIPIAIAVLIAGALAGWAYHHFRTPTGELHTTFGVSRTASNEISIPTSAPHVALTFKSGAEAPDHHIRFL